MKNKWLLLIVPFLIASGLLSAQADLRADSLLLARGQVVLLIEASNRAEVEELGKLLSVDSWNGHQVRAYASRSMFEAFLLTGKPYIIEIQDRREEDYPVASSEGFKTANWDVYPTYPAYDTIMHGFATAYPTLCRIDTIGYSTLNRLLLATVIKGNSGGKPVPQFLYTSSMHGDELTGYILCLRFIDYLLSGYGTDPRITRLLDSSEIWINPLANPDGAYWNGNGSVTGAIRFNANYLDINRNFPDPKDGPHPDQNPWQAETMAFMALANRTNFTMSANFHGGAEVVNYPWDTWAKLPADNQWWILVSKQYADTAQYYGPPGYLDDFTTGFINGYTWYSINGGRQDYMNYFHRCREVTLEISNTKTPPALQLPNFWNYNYRSMLNYYEQVLFGLGGIVYDSLTKQPLRAKVSIAGHDTDSSHVYSRAADGYFKRLLYAGNWNVTFSLPGYVSKTLAVQIQNGQQTFVEVPLATDVSVVKSTRKQEFALFPNPAIEEVEIRFPEGSSVKQIGIYTLDGRLVRQYVVDSKGYDRATLPLSGMSKGVYLLKVEGNGIQATLKLVKN